MRARALHALRPLRPIAARPTTTPSPSFLLRLSHLSRPASTDSETEAETDLDADSPTTPSPRKSELLKAARSVYSPTPNPTPVPTSDFLATVMAAPPVSSPTRSPIDIDWTSSFYGLGIAPFEPKIADVLAEPLNPADIEVKPDGIIYLPEIKYRRILNRAFGPGGWGLAPRSELAVGEKVVTREYALVAHGRYIAQARGEASYFAEEDIPTAGEGSKSNALMRCCKDLGIGWQLWDPRFIRQIKKEHLREVWVEHMATKKVRKIWIRKGDDPPYPFALKK